VRFLHPEAHQLLRTTKSSRLPSASFVFSAQYQQNPLSPEGNIIKAGVVLSFTTAYPNREYGDQVVQSWDNPPTSRASSNDFFGLHHPGWSRETSTF